MLLRRSGRFERRGRWDLFRRERGNGRFPATSQSPIYLDQPKGDLPVRLGLQVLLLDERLGHEHEPGWIDGPRLVLRDENVAGLLGVFHAAVEACGAIVGLQESHQGVFRFRIRLEHGVPICRQEFLKLRVLKLHVVHNSAIIQDFPLERGADVAIERSCAVKRAKFAACQPSWPMIPILG